MKRFAAAFAFAILATAPPAIGNIVLSEIKVVGTGEVYYLTEYTPAGAYARTIYQDASLEGAGEVMGMCADPDSLFALMPRYGWVDRYTLDGVSAWGGGNAADCVIDSAVFFGQRFWDSVRRYSLDGHFDGELTVPMCCHSIDLADDHCTLFYTAGGYGAERNTVYRYDVCRDAALPAFASFSRSAEHVSLAWNGDVFVLQGDGVLRMSSAGVLQQTYPISSLDPAPPSLSYLDLDPDGATFWAASQGRVYRVDIASGAQVHSFLPRSGARIFSMAVWAHGEIPQPILTVAMSAAPVANSPGAIRYTIHYANQSPTVAAVNVRIRASVPAGTSFLSTGPGGVHASGTVSFHIQQLPPGGGGSVFFDVRLDDPGTSVINSGYTIEADGVAPVTGDPVVLAAGDVPALGGPALLVLLMALGLTAWAKLKV